MDSVSASKLPPHAPRDETRRDKRPFGRISLTAVLSSGQGSRHVSQIAVSREPTLLPFTPACKRHGSQRVLAEPSQLGISKAEMRFIFNKGTAKVSTTF